MTDLDQLRRAINRHTPKISQSNTLSRYRVMSLFVNFLSTYAPHWCVQEAAYASIKLIEPSSGVGRFWPVTPFGDEKLRSG